MHNNMNFFHMLNLEKMQQECRNTLFNFINVNRFDYSLVVLTNDGACPSIGVA